MGRSQGWRDRKKREDPVDCALDLLRRMPPQKTGVHLSALCQLRPDLAEDLLGAVDQPLKVLSCQQTGKEFLACDYNRDASSFRSPWSSKYQPPCDGVQPSAALLPLEQSLNDAFATYREMSVHIPFSDTGTLFESQYRYFGGGVSSVYLWDLDQGFAGVVLLKKVHDEPNHTGSWDATHVFEVQPRKKQALYKLTSTIIVNTTATSPSLSLGGSVTRQTEQELPLDAATTHLVNIGRLIEDMEIKMRGSIQDIYFGKTGDILNELRSVVDLKTVKAQAAIQAQLAGRLQNRQK